MDRRSFVNMLSGAFAFCLSPFSRTEQRGLKQRGALPAGLECAGSQEPFSNIFVPDKNENWSTREQMARVACGIALEVQAADEDLRAAGRSFQPIYDFMDKLGRNNPRMHHAVLLECHDIAKLGPVTRHPKLDKEGKGWQLGDVTHRYILHRSQRAYAQGRMLLVGQTILVVTTYTSQGGRTAVFYIDTPSQRIKALAALEQIQDPAGQVLAHVLLEQTPAFYSLYSKV